MLAVIVVKLPAAADDPPMTLLFTVPPDIVRSSATYPSATAVPVQAPDVIVPVVVIDVMFPVVRNVPSTLGKVSVRSAEGSVTARVVS